MRGSTFATMAAFAAMLTLPGRAETTDPAAAWDIVSGVVVEEVGSDESWRVTKTFPDGYADGAETFTISGWAVIYEAQADVSEILLVPQAEDCPFCGGTGETYGPTLEVVFERPVGVEAPEDRITVEGRLVAVTDTDTFQAFRLVDARLVPDGEG